MWLLLKVKAYRVLTHEDLTSVRTLEGEFHRAELAQLVNSPSRNQLVLDAFLKYAATVNLLEGALPAADTTSSSSSSSSSISGGKRSSEKDSGGVEGSSLLEDDVDVEERQRQKRQALQGRVAVHRKAVAFAVDIAHAVTLQEIFLEAGEGVWGCL